MDFGQAVKSTFSKYATFSGRAPRSEYWYFFLFTTIVYLVTNVLDVAVFDAATVFSLIASLVFLVPSLSVGVRRLHDTDHSGWWCLLGLVPVVGWIVLIVWFCQRGTAGSNRFGPDPLAGSTVNPSLAQA